jgi:hypothetical protein
MSCAKILKLLTLRYGTLNYDEGPPSSSVGQAVSRRPVFDPRSVHVRFVEDKEATEKAFSHEIRFFPENINHPLLRTNLDLTHILLLSERQTAKSGNPPKSFFFKKTGNIG